MPFTRSPSRSVARMESAGSLTNDIQRLAQLPSHLILEGEPGVGKRFCAYLIHMGQPRGRSGNFIEITPEISEEEVRVIFFDEDRRRQEGILGRTIPRCDPHCTIFLRRIGEFSLLVQTRTERFLIQLEADATRGKLTPRVIASSTIPWPEIARGKHVIEPLVRRISGFERFVIPPLRERQQDIPIIVANILRGLSRKPGARALRMEPDTLATLTGHRWWGNVQELRLVIQEGAALSTGSSLRLPERFFDEPELMSDLLRAIQSGHRVSIEGALGFLEKTIVQRALMHAGFDYARASRLLGLTEQNLRYRIRKHNIYIPTGEN